MKRANGTGSIRWNEERKRYEVRITIDGKRRKVSAATQAEAWAKADALRSGPPLSDPTVEEWLGVWLDRLTDSDLSPVTLDGYRYIVDRLIVPTLGGHRLSALKPSHVEDLLRSTTKANRSAHTVRRIKQVLGRALTVAEREELVSRNVARLVDGPRLETKRDRALTPDQYRQLVASLDERPSGHGGRPDPLTGLLVVFLASTGLRRGEALALEWRDVDLDARTIRVERSMKRNTSTGEDFVGEPKTPKSRRTVHLSHVVVDRLRKTDPPASRFVRVFPFRLDTAGRAVSRYCSRVLGESFTPHELRHSAASLMVNQGVPLKTVSDTMGHASIAITADLYAHLSADSRAETAKAFDALI